MTDSKDMSGCTCQVAHYENPQGREVILCSHCQSQQIRVGGDAVARVMGPMEMWITDWRERSATARFFMGNAPRQWRDLLTFAREQDEQMQELVEDARTARAERDRSCQLAVEMHREAHNMFLAAGAATVRAARLREALELAGCQKPREGGDECGGVCVVCAALAGEEVEA